MSEFEFEAVIKDATIEKSYGLYLDLKNIEELKKQVSRAKKHVDVFISLPSGDYEFTYSQFQRLVEGL